MRCNICFLVESVHESTHIGMSKYIAELVNNISQLSLISFPCYMVEEFSQKRITFWDKISSFNSREIIRSFVIIPCDEESIHERLSVEICKVMISKIMKYFFFKNIVEFEKVRKFICRSCLITEHISEIITDAFSLSTHDLRKMFRRTDSIDIIIYEVFGCSLENTE